MNDDQKGYGNPWEEVFSSCGKNVDVNEKVSKVTEWGLEIMDMLHADKQDTDALCEQLNLEGAATKKFHQAVSKALIKYSPWSFLRDTLDDEKKSEELINTLNNVEKPPSMLTDEDIKLKIISYAIMRYFIMIQFIHKSQYKYLYMYIHREICEECQVSFGDVRNVIGWYKTLEPLTGQTKGVITTQKICEYIKKLFTEYDLPFFAMEEADEEDIDQLGDQLSLNKEQIIFFQTNVTAQLKLAGLMTAVKE